jgi:hypothetical protein
MPVFLISMTVAKICIYENSANMNGMDARLLDVIIGVAGFIILTVLLAVLPLVMKEAVGAAYLIAIVVFILFLAIAGYKVNEQIA